jgi:hypothetical protein
MIRSDIASHIEPTSGNATRSTVVRDRVRGNNADLIVEVAKLYVRDEDIIADVTYGPGVFWSKMDCMASDLEPLEPMVTKADFRALPYSNASIDTVVLDPPYAHHASRHITGRRYDRLCKDEIESAKQRRSHIELWLIARELGFDDQDLFTLEAGIVNCGRWRRQLHARKTQSYLWIFRKLSEPSLS